MRELVCDVCILIDSLGLRQMVSWMGLCDFDFDNIDSQHWVFVNVKMMKVGAHLLLFL